MIKSLKYFFLDHLLLSFYTFFLSDLIYFGFFYFFFHMSFSTEFFQPQAQVSPTKNKQMNNSNNKNLSTFAM